MKTNPSLIVEGINNYNHQTTKSSESVSGLLKCSYEKCSSHDFLKNYCKLNLLRFPRRVGACMQKLNGK